MICLLFIQKKKKKMEENIKKSEFSLNRWKMITKQKSYNNLQGRVGLGLSNVYSTSKGLKIRETPFKNDCLFNSIIYFDPKVDKNVTIYTIPKHISNKSFKFISKLLELKELIRNKYEENKEKEDFFESFNFDVDYEVAYLIKNNKLIGAYFIADIKSRICRGLEENLLKDLFEEMEILLQKKHKENQSTQIKQNKT